MFMKKLKFVTQGLVYLVALVSLTACSAPPVDHESFACEKFGEMRQVWNGTDSDFDEVRASVASLGGVLAVWQTEKGEEEPLYWKISRYMKDFTSMIMDSTPESARAYFATEDEVLAEIETNCALPSTYVAPLKIHGGCWNNKSVKAQLQSRFEGKWVNEQKVVKLSKIDSCTEAKYPWGVEFVERRAPQDEAQDFRIIWSDADGLTFASGKYKHVSCPVPASQTDLEIQIWWEDCDS
jgi:hypothetical protein